MMTRNPFRSPCPSRLLFPFRSLFLSLCAAALCAGPGARAADPVFSSDRDQMLREVAYGAYAPIAGGAMGTREAIRSVIRTVVEATPFGDVEKACMRRALNSSANLSSGLNALIQVDTSARNAEFHVEPLRSLTARLRAGEAVEAKDLARGADLTMTPFAFDLDGLRESQLTYRDWLQSIADELAGCL